MPESWLSSMALYALLVALAFVIARHQKRFHTAGQSLRPGIGADSRLQEGSHLPFRCGSMKGITPMQRWFNGIVNAPWEGL